jgi:hypothetical protein
MPINVEAESPLQTPLLLIEADSDARSRHEGTLRAGGYAVFAVAASPDAIDLDVAAVVLSDIASFHWLEEQHSWRLGQTIVITADDRAGATACLCGAAAWVPVDSDDGYLLATLDGVLDRHRR